MQRNEAKGLWHCKEIGHSLKLYFLYYAMWPLLHFLPGLVSRQWNTVTFLFTLYSEHTTIKFSSRVITANLNSTKALVNATQHKRKKLSHTYELIPRSGLR